MPRAKSSTKPAKKATKAVPAKKATTAKVAKAAVVTDPVELLANLKSAVYDLEMYLQENGSAPQGADEDDDESEHPEEAAHDERKAELEKTNIRTLRKMAAEHFEEDAIEGAEKSDLVKNLLAVEFPDLYPDADDEDDDEDEDDESEDSDEDEDDDEDDDEEGEEEEEKVTRADLLKLTVKELKAIAIEKEIYDSLGEMKGMDRDTLVDAIIEAAGEEDDEEEDESEYYTREDYEAMNIKELKAIADEVGVKYPKAVKQDALIDLLLEEDEDE